MASSRKTVLRLNHEVAQLDLRTKTLRFANGAEARYDYLISSLPLPELIPLIVGAPREVADAAANLAATTCVVVNVGIAREDISDAHWTYFYDPDFSFTRVSFPHMQSSRNAPPGAGSIQAELYYSSKYRPLDRLPDECIEPVLTDLRRCGLLREDDTLLFREARLIPYANVIFDLDRRRSVAILHGFLAASGIQHCGRYGDWGYNWTDESFLSGESAAQRILDGRHR